MQRCQVTFDSRGYSTYLGGREVDAQRPIARRGLLPELGSSASGSKALAIFRIGNLLGNTSRLSLSRVPNTQVRISQSETDMSPSASPFLLFYLHQPYVLLSAIGCGRHDQCFHLGRHAKQADEENNRRKTRYGRALPGPRNCRVRSSRRPGSKHVRCLPISG